MYQQGAPLTADLSVAVYLYQPGDGGLDRVAMPYCWPITWRGAA